MDKNKPSAQHAVKIIIFLGIWVCAAATKTFEHPALLISPAQKKDMPACTNICMLPENLPHLFPEFNETQMSTFLKNAQKSSMYKFLIAQKKNTIVGLAVCFKENSKTWNIDILAVNRKHQRQGIGSHLLSAIKKISQSTKTPTSLIVKRSNQPAISCYTKQQFRLVKSYGTDPGSYQEFQFVPPNLP